MRLAKQEYARKIFLKNKSIQQAPILSITPQKTESSEINLIDRKIFIEKTIDKGTAKYFENGILKVKIELDLHHEIIKGYLDCHKKLKLDNKEKCINWDIIDNEFVIKYEASKKELDAFRKEYSEHPDDFE